MVKTRFAPSPTGAFLHIGSIRTALYSYLLAKQNKGVFALRIEDTDRSRFVEGASDAFLTSLKQFGLLPDEGYGVGGDNGPYVQSERLPLYSKYLHKMVQDGFAYYCFATVEEVENDRSEKELLGLPTHFQSPYRDLPYSEAKIKVDSGAPFSIRLKVPKGEKIIAQDMIRGRLEWATSEVEDQILLKTDGIPTYHGAVVFDDHAMGITHVFRGEEWISSYPKQILTARAIGVTLPEYAHLPLILGSDRRKLSKRNGDVSVDVFLEKGYLISAIINYIALLGWNPKTTEEFFTLEELIERFDPKNIQKAGAVFDIEKLTWMNGKYIAKLPSEELYTLLDAHLARYNPEYYKNTWQSFDRSYHMSVIKEISPRLPMLSDFPLLAQCCYDRPDNYDISVFCNEKMKVTNAQDVLSALRFAQPFIESTRDMSADEQSAYVLAAIAEAGYKNGQILYPLRVALSGVQFSPGAFELIRILGSDEASLRLKNALSFVSSSHELSRT